MSVLASLRAAGQPWLEAALSFLYPPVCQICGNARAGPVEGYVCEGCRRGPDGVRPIRPPWCERCGLPFAGALTTAFECSNCRDQDLAFTTARAAAAAAGVVLEVIHRYKYAGATWLEPFLAGLLVDAAAPALAPGRWDAIVPVPLFPLKERERGFNQAERLARQLSRATSIPLHTRWVRRVRPTRTQTLLDRAARAANMHRAFAPAPGARCDGARVVLVDDVLTTGATTSNCARALRAAGAAEVCVWTVARGV
jgi:competence protein ComFC